MNTFYETSSKTLYVHKHFRNLYMAFRLNSTKYSFHTDALSKPLKYNIIATIHFSRLVSPLFNDAFAPLKFPIIKVSEIYTCRTSHYCSKVFE